MIRRRASRVAILVLLSGSSWPVAASADHSNTANAGDPDNGDHYIDRNSLNSNADAAARWGVDQLNRASDMHATFTGSGDVEIYDYYYGDTDWFGRTDCPDGANWLTGNCDVFRVRFNESTMIGHSLDHWRSLGCHELGHTAGLGHRHASDDANDNSCMRSEIWPREYDGHDLDAIDAAV